MVVFINQTKNAWNSSHQLLRLPSLLPLLQRSQLRGRAFGQSLPSRSRCLSPSGQSVRLSGCSSTQQGANSPYNAIKKHVKRTKQHHLRHRVYDASHYGELVGFNRCIYRVASHFLGNTENNFPFSERSLSGGHMQGRITSVFSDFRRASTYASINNNHTTG